MRILFLTAFLLSFANTFSQQAGSIDSTFGIHGLATISPGNLDSKSTTSAIQTDGKIIIGGHAGGNFALVRLTSSGNLDQSFGDSGKVVTAIGTHGAADVNALALQSDGKIIAAGNSYDGTFHYFTLIRYEANGLVDSGFGTSGVVVTHVGTTDSYILSILLENNDKIIVAGWVQAGPKTDIALARYQTNGLLDSTFANNGIQITDINGKFDYARALAFEADQKIMVAGNTQTSTNESISLLGRYTTAGILDSTFGTNGFITTSFPGAPYSRANSIIIQPDGKIVTLSDAWTLLTGYFALARYESDGSPDNTFSSDGKIMASVEPGNNWGGALALDGNGRLLAVGTCMDTATTITHMALLRFTPIGDPDIGFGNNGQLKIVIGTTDLGTSCLIQPDGKILVAGYSFLISKNKFSVERYFPDAVTNVDDPKQPQSYCLVYPNPTSSQLKINSVGIPVETIRIYNTTGQLILEINHPVSNTIDVGGLAKGIYMGEIKTAKDRVTRRFVKM